MSGTQRFREVHLAPACTPACAVLYLGKLGEEMVREVRCYLHWSRHGEGNGREPVGRDRTCAVNVSYMGGNGWRWVL
jgi:hypothetical protein